MNNTYLPGSTAAPSADCARRGSTVTEVDASEPSVSYVICTNPRSGSWLLSEGLESTGIAGRPREWFHEATEHDLCNRAGLPAPADAGYGRYLAEVKQAGRIANGVFGLKLHYYQFEELRTKLRLLTDVPGTGIYAYTASGGGNDSGWVGPLGGTWNASAGPDTQYIQWAPGPTVGQAVYQASPNYSWGRDVNVVAITIDNNSIGYNKTPIQDAQDGNLIISSGQGDAMTANVAVDIAGPIVDGGMRGVKFMKFGFMQNLQFTAMHGVFSGFTPPETRVSSLEGATLLDTYDGAPIPWADVNGPIQNLPDAAANDVQLTITDTPKLTFSDLSVLSGNGMANVPIDGASIVMNATLYVAACTTEFVNNASSAYVQLAMANWHFNGSGTVAGAGVGTFGTWTGIMGQTETSGDMTFTVITTGANVPITSRPRVNDALDSEQWTTVPPF